VSSLAAVAPLVAGVVMIVAGAEIFFDGLLSSASRLRTSPFVVAVLLSGLELENLAADIAATRRGCREPRPAPSSAARPSSRSRSAASPRSPPRSGPTCHVR
jgi:hypothetical protein